MRSTKSLFTSTLTALFLLAVSGCSTPLAVSPLESPQANAAAPCSPRPQETRPSLLPGELLTAAIEAEQDYRDCATRHDSLREWATKARQYIDKLKP